LVVHTGIVGQMVVSGSTLSGANGSLTEGTLVVGKERGKFNAVGTDVPEHTTGMNDVSGTLKRKWVSGDTLFQDLVDGDIEFEVAISINVSGSGATVTGSGCIGTTVTRRLAPGTEVLMEEMPFVGRDWY